MGGPGGPHRGPPGGPPGPPPCTFFWVFNNSPSRDSFGPLFWPPPGAPRDGVPSRVPRSSPQDGGLGVGTPPSDGTQHPVWVELRGLEGGSWSLRSARSNLVGYGPPCWMELRSSLGGLRVVHAVAFTQTYPSWVPVRHHAQRAFGWNPGALGSSAATGPIAPLLRNGGYVALRKSTSLNANGGSHAQGGVA